jgi:hypothetical protein
MRFYLPYAKQDSYGGELAPGLSDGHTDGSNERENRADEDGSPTAEPVVQWIGNPSRAVKRVSLCSIFEGSKIRCMS